MKTVVITGANGNIGVAAVTKFLDSGYKVIGVDFSDSNLQFAKGNKNFSIHPVDLTNEEAVMAFIGNMIAEHGRIDAVLLLAGGFAMGDIHSIGESDLQKMYALNFLTAFNLTRAAYPQMLKNGYGRVIFIGARPALKPEQGKNMMAYALTKSLLFTFAEQLNEEATGKNVVAAVVVPSTVDTQLNRKSMPDADPSNWVKPLEIAEILEMITSEKGNVLRETVLKVYNNA